jgi:hypothetical protein
MVEIINGFLGLNGKIIYGLLGINGRNHQRLPRVKWQKNTNIVLGFNGKN